MTIAPRLAAPPARLISGHLSAYRRDQLGFFTMCARRYGDIVPLRFGPTPILVLNHPDDIEDVLVTRNQLFIKPFWIRGLEPLTDHGLLNSEGDFWLRQRRLASPPFTVGASPATPRSWWPKPSRCWPYGATARCAMCMPT